MRRTFPLFLILFLICFPKGGIKIGTLPLTWGYLLLTGAGLILTLQNFHPIRRERLYAFAATLPLFFLFLFTLARFGALNSGFTTSFLFSFSLLPFIAYLSFSKPLENLETPFFLQSVRRAIFFVSCFGLALFFFKIFTGRYAGIPFLTSDTWDLQSVGEKHNQRLSFFKLISTYHNGNLFGISLLMLLPLYRYLESSRLKVLIVYLALIFTLSRTVWSGLFFVEAIRFFFLEGKRAFLLILLVVAFLVSGSFWYWDVICEFMFDPNLGGRMEFILHALSSIRCFPSRPFEGVSESSYVSILLSFGIVGLIAFCIALCAPLYLYLHKGSRSPVQSRLWVGLLTYLFVSLSDGALLYIPVMAFYWLISSFILRNAPIELGEAASCRSVLSRSPWQASHQVE